MCILSKPKSLFGMIANEKVDYDDAIKQLFVGSSNLEVPRRAQSDGDVASDDSFIDLSSQKVNESVVSQSDDSYLDFRSLTGEESAKNDAKRSQLDQSEDRSEPKSSLELSQTEDSFEAKAVGVQEANTKRKDISHPKSHAVWKIRKSAKGSRGLYQVNQNVFARDNGEIYEATIKEINEGDDKSSMKYYIHYHGWSKRHDKWVRERDVLPDTKENAYLVEVSKEKLREALNKRKEKKIKKLQTERKKKERKKRSKDMVKCIGDRKPLISSVICSSEGSNGLQGKQRCLSHLIVI